MLLFLRWREISCVIQLLGARAVVQTCSNSLQKMQRVAIPSLGVLDLGSVRARRSQSCQLQPSVRGDELCAFQFPAAARSILVSPVRLQRPFGLRCRFASPIHLSRYFVLKSEHQ